MILQACFAAGDLEQRLDLFGKNPFANHPFAEPGIIQLAAANGADAIEHLFLFLREMARQPLLEQRRDRVRQAAVSSVDRQAQVATVL